MSTATHSSNALLYQRVLVTGSTGFLGAYIVKALVEKGHQVRALRRASATTPDFIAPEIWSKVEWIEGDILDLGSLDEAMESVDAIVHAAALVSFRPGDRSALLQVNQDGTANVVNMALEKGVSRLVYISSVAALGRTADGQTVNEQKKWTDSKVNTQYAISKHKAEMEVWRGAAEGLSTVILNPSTILGFGNWNQSSCAIFKHAYKEFPYYTEGVNGFVGVEDVARITEWMLNSKIDQERFIVNAENWSFEALLNTIAKLMHKKPPSRKATAGMSEFAWRWEAFKSWFSKEPPLLTRESARVAQSKTYFDNQKIIQAIPGFSFTPIKQVIEESATLYLRRANN